MTTIKPYTLFLAGLLAGGVGSAGVIATAAPGDLIYEEHNGQQCIEQAEAACYAQCAISANLWTGTAADMTRTSARRSPGCDSGFSASVSGFKAAAAGDVPQGVTVHGVKE